jgi:hypothetical protein
MIEGGGPNLYITGFQLFQKWRHIIFVNANSSGFVPTGIAANTGIDPLIGQVDSLAFCPFVGCPFQEFIQYHLGVFLWPWASL